MLKISNQSILLIIILAILGVITVNTTLDFVQIISELSLLLIFIYLGMKLKFKKYEIFVIIFLFLTHLVAFPLISNKVFFLQAKNSFLGFFSLLIIPKLIFDKLRARRFLNYFLILNIFITIFNLTFKFFTQNELQVSGGGLFQNFHYNGFILGIWAISSYAAIDYKQLLLGYSIYKTTSKTSFIAYFLSVIYINRDFFKLRIKQVKRGHYLFFLLIIFSCGIYFIFRDLDSTNNFMFFLGTKLEERSLYVVFDQLTNVELINNSLRIFPGDFNSYNNVEVCSELVSKCISNEIGYYYYMMVLGIVNFISICFLIFKHCKKVVPFLLLSLFHYSYILSPLTYIIYFSYTSLNDHSKNKNLLNENS